MKKLENRGISLVEVVIGTSILLGIMLGVMGAYSLYVRVTLGNTAKLQAIFLAEEGIEAIRSIRDADWDSSFGTWSSDTTYGLDKGTAWSVSTGAKYEFGKFERSFVISDVYRDANDDIADTGTLDSLTKKVDVSVSWSTNSGTTTEQLSAYFTNVF